MERFRKLLGQKPNPGDLLTTQDGKPIKLGFVRRDNGSVIHTSAVVDEDATGWYLADEMYGLKVMIHGRDHKKLLEGKMEVTEIRVIRSSMDGKSLIGEVVR